MFPYWLFFMIPAFAALATNPRNRFRRDGTRSTLPDLGWILVLLALTIIIGFRFQVGGDWYNYFRYLRDAAGLSLVDALLRDDPGFWLLNVISLYFDWGITGVNTMGGLIFSLGLVLFCRSLPRPWLALAVAMPYTVIVVGMGYSRQSIALGFAMIAFISLTRKSYLTFVFWIIMGAAFHKTAVLLVPLAALTITKNRFLIGGLILVTSAIAYQVLLSESANHLLSNYTDTQIQSQGALIRLGMNAMAGIIFLKYRHKFKIAHAEFILWRLYSLMAVVMFIALFVLPISTALDRLGLYVLPLQMVVFSHLPDVLGRYGGRNQTLVAGILLYYTTVLFVWLNFGTFSKLWLPYLIHF